MDIFKLQNRYIGLLILSTFGPYLTTSPGIRTDHIVIYALFLGSIFFLFVPSKRIHVRISKQSLESLLLIFFLYFFQTTWMVIRSLFTNKNYDIVEFLAAFEGIFQPLAIMIFMFIFIFNFSYYNVRIVLKKSIMLLLFLLMINSILSLLSLRYDMWWLLSFFNGQESGTAQSSLVWLRTILGHRFIGIYNQPFEAGLIYSIALLAWGYIRTITQDVSLYFYFLLLGIVIGGVLSFSKVFFIVGLPLFLFYILKQNYIFIKTIKNYKAVLFFLALLWLFFSNITFFENFFEAKFEYFQSREILEIISGGRFGKDISSNMQIHFMEIWKESPVLGVGFPVDYALDSSFLLYFAYGGLVSVCIYCAILINIMFIAGKKSVTLCEERNFLLFMMFLIGCSSFGAPTLTLNRVSVLIWILIFLCVVIIQSTESRVSRKLTNED